MEKSVRSFIGMLYSVLLLLGPHRLEGTSKEERELVLATC